MSEGFKGSEEEEIAKRGITNQHIVDRFARGMQKRTELYLDKVKAKDYENKEELVDPAEVLEENDLIQSANIGPFRSHAPDIGIITPEEVKKLLKPKEDELLKEATAVVREVVKGNLEQHIFEGSYEVYLKQEHYPKQIVQRLVKMMEQAGWDVKTSDTADMGDENPSTKLVLKIKEEN